MPKFFVSDILTNILSTNITALLHLQISLNRHQQASRCIQKNSNPDMPHWYGLYADVYNILAKISISSDILLLVHSKWVWILDRPCSSPPLTVYNWLGYHTHKFLCYSQVLFVSAWGFWGRAEDYRREKEAVTVDDDYITR